MKKEKVFTRALRAVRRGLRAYNHRLSRVYSPNIAAWTGVTLVLLMLAFTLFVPPAAGVADDGSLSEVMLETGLGYRRQDLDEPTGSYFIRLYLHSNRQADGISIHRQLIRLAMWADDQLTHDNLFDIRVLTAVYILLYLPAVYLVLRGIAARVKVAAEATFLVVLGAVMLGDAGITASFASLYPDALWHIGVVYCLGFSLALQHSRPGWTHVGLIGLTVTGGALTLTESHCAAVGLVLTVYLARLMMMEDRTAQTTVLAGFCAAFMLAVTMVSATAGATRFTEASRLHAMTNGVLLRAENPEEALAEFGIDPRFETLTDMSSYSEYPYALSGNPELQRSFLSKYSLGSIMFYYVRHPLECAGLLEMGIRAAFHPVRGYVGSFEREAGLAPRAVNTRLTYYSNFKANSLPQTSGFLLILLGVYWALFRRRRGLNPHQTRWSFRERQIMLDTFLMLLLMGTAHLLAVIFLSGTAELERYQLLCGSCIDGMMLLFVAEILHRLNILSSEE